MQLIPDASNQQPTAQTTPDTLMADLIALADKMIRDEMARGSGPAPLASTTTQIPQLPTKPVHVPPPNQPALNYAYQAHELINLELMKRHETNSWRAYNQDTDQTRASIVLAGQALAQGIEQTNVKRKRDETQNERDLQQKKRQLYTLMNNVQSVRRALD